MRVRITVRKKDGTTFERTRKGRGNKTGSIYLRPGSENWQIAYYDERGQLRRESSGTTSFREAENLLKARNGEVEKGTCLPSDAKHKTVGDVYQLLIDDYKMHKRASVESAEARWWAKVRNERGEVQQKPGRLQEWFGRLRAAELSTELLNRYVTYWQSQGLADATINRDLSALKRAYHLAHDATPPLVRSVPKFPHLQEAPPRTGFVEEDEYHELASHATGLWLRALLAVAYKFGFRKGELLRMKVNQINLGARTIRLWRGTTKSGEPRFVKMAPGSDVLVLLTACCVDKLPDDHVFDRNGRPIRDFRERWNKLTKAAGLEGLLFHDLRRSAVRNMVRSGVPERVAMAISGHKTADVFARYNIVSERDFDDAASRIEQRINAQSYAQSWPQPPQASQLSN